MPNTQPERDNRWLLQQIVSLWNQHFSDVTLDNRIQIKFSRESKYRFGSIKYNDQVGSSQILINSRFKSPAVPEEVVLHTIAHELCHYTHGFSSKKKKLHKYPHKGNVIDKEMYKRGLGNLISSYKTWVKEYIKMVH